ncbi:MAG: hypothetical protein ABI846_04285 [Rudaea sp.]
MRIVFALLSLLPVVASGATPPGAVDSSAEFRAAGALAMQADMKAALVHLLRVQPAALAEDRRRVWGCMRERFVEKKPPPLPVDLDPWAARVLSTYRRYWTHVMLGTQTAAQGERELAATLATTLALPAGAEAAPEIAPGMDKLEPLLSAKFDARGLHALFGVTAPLREFMLWRKQSDQTYDIDLPSGREAVHVTMMEDFLSLGWLGYAVCDYHHTGGWATPERLFAVRSAYDLDSESFKVSYLAHEGQHFSDYRRFPGLAQPDLEYRAKLVELSKADTSLYELIAAFAANGSANREQPHPWSDRQVVNDLAAKLALDAPTPETWKRVPVAQIQAAARDLLEQDSRRRAADR